jgi:hypothetical protein
VLFFVGASLVYTTSIAEANLDAMSHFDALATLEIENYDWQIRLYRLVDPIVPLSQADFVPMLQRAAPLYGSDEHMVWPPPRPPANFPGSSSRGRSGGGRRGQGRPRGRAAGQARGVQGEDPFWGPDSVAEPEAEEPTGAPGSAPVDLGDMPDEEVAALFMDSAGDDPEHYELQVSRGGKQQTVSHHLVLGVVVEPHDVFVGFCFED